MQDESPSSAYPMVRFLVARGRTLAFALAGLILLAAVLAGFVSGQLWVVPAGILLDVVLLALLLSYVEVLRIIADTLIPKY